MVSNAQIGINTDDPHESSILELMSSDKGFLAPRMSTMMREAIISPANGLMVYDTTTISFWYFDDEWNEIRNGSEILNTSDLFGESIEPDFSCLSIMDKEDINGSSVIGTALSGKYAYIVDANGYLEVIDVSDPTNLKTVSSQIIGNSLVSIAVSSDGNYAYAIDRDDTDLKVIDVSNPVNPSIVGNLSIGTDPESIAFSDNYVFIIDTDTNDLRIIDVSDPANPFLAGSLGIGSFPKSIYVSGNYAYITDLAANNLIIIDISNPVNPNQIGNLGIGSTPQAVVVSGSYAYIVDSQSKDLKVIDVSDPSNPTLSGSLKLGNGVNFFPNNVAVAGNYAFTVDSQNEIKIIDISDPFNPLLTTALSTGQIPETVIISGNYAYVATVGNDKFNAIQLNCSEFSVVRIDPFSGGLTTSGLESISDNLGDHTATTHLDLANFHIINGDTITAGFFSDTAGVLNTSLAKIGDINLGDESVDQSNSNLMGNGFTTTPWVYTNAVQAQGERNGQSTLITVGNDGVYGVNDEIHLITKGVSRLQVDNNGRVGIGRDPTSRRLEVNGNASKNSAGDWLANSDARLKKRIKMLDSEVILEKLLALNGITYEWDDDSTGYDRPEGIQYGFTAQNIQEVFPTLVIEDEQGYLQTAYGTYDAMYVEAFRALIKRIQNLETENQRLLKLEKEMAAIKAMLVENDNNLEE